MVVLLNSGGTDQDLGKQTDCHLQEHTKIGSCLERLPAELMWGSPESHLGRTRVCMRGGRPPNASHVTAAMELRVEHKCMYLSQVKDVYV